MKKALVLGLGLSGRAACALLLKKGYKVAACDKNSAVFAHEEVVRLCAQGLRVFHEQETPELFDLLVPSPGVSPSHPHYQYALAQNIEILGEAALAFSEMENPAVAITGTNGKTTVTLLVEHILKSSGRKARALGNVGEALCAYFLHPDPEEIVVAELSSYQLETLDLPVFDSAVILNITPDHLDRYANMESYARAKCRLARCLKKNAPLYIHQNIEDEFGYCLENTFYVTFEERADHDQENARAAWLLVKGFGITDEQFSQALKTFKKPAHRIEFVTRIHEVDYFDDSKGTNLDAVMVAVRAMKGPVILIAGGVDKGASYKPWIESFRGKVKKIFTLGAAAPKMEQELGCVFSMQRVSTLEEAVISASSVATRGDAVLLSPGCASFDMFRDYAHRGEEFKRCVYDLGRSQKL